MTSASPPPEHEWRTAEGAASDAARDEHAEAAADGPPPDAAPPGAPDAPDEWAPPAQDQTWPEDGSWPPPPPPVPPVAAAGVDDDGWRPVAMGRPWEAPGPADPEPAEPIAGTDPTAAAESAPVQSPAGDVWPPPPDPDEDSWIAAGPDAGQQPQAGDWPPPETDERRDTWAPPEPGDRTGDWAAPPATDDRPDAWGPPAAGDRASDWAAPPAAGAVAASDWAAPPAAGGAGAGGWADPPAAGAAGAAAGAWAAPPAGNGAGSGEWAPPAPAAPPGDGHEPWTPSPGPADDGRYTWPSSLPDAAPGAAWAPPTPDGGPLPPPDEPWTPADPGRPDGAGAADPPSRTWVTDEATGTVRYGDPVGWSPPAEPPAPDPAEVPSALLGGAPPRSPAYSAPVSDAYQAPVEPPPMVESPAGGRNGRKVGLIALAVLAVLALVGGLVAVLGGGDEPEDFSFGRISATGRAASVVTETGADGRALEVGEDVLAGWVIAAKDDSTVTIDLDGGGVARFDRGASLTFSDLGRRGGSHKPAVQIDGGRTWVNPAGQLGSEAITFTVPGGTVATSGNPVAIDCTSTCSIEAPAGGVTLTTTGGSVATPGENEKVSIESADNLSLLTSAGPSDWAQQNLDADKDADLRAPGESDTVGVKAGSIVDGGYLINIKITSEPTGDAIPEELQYHVDDGTYSANLTIDGSACVTLPCDMAVTSSEGATGTARIADGALTLTLTLPVPCKDENGNVVVASVGSDVVQATMPVIDARLAGDRWRAVAFQGTGTIAATLSTPCSPDNTLGTATNEIAVSGTATT